MSDDDDAFKALVKDIKPLKSSNRISDKSKVKCYRQRPKSVEDDFFQVPYIYEAETVMADSELSYLKENVDKKLLRQLKQGKLKPSHTLDLHGHTVNMGEYELTEFFNYVKMQDIRTVLIIHGKGRQAADTAPKLKNLVNRFLRSSPNVLAFCSAKPCDGGLGAVYVLLKKGT